LRNELCKSPDPSISKGREPKDLLFATLLWNSCLPKDITENTKIRVKCFKNCDDIYEAKYKIEAYPTGKVSGGTVEEGKWTQCDTETERCATVADNNLQGTELRWVEVNVK
jgi:hypothetical protein